MSAIKETHLSEIVCTLSILLLSNILFAQALGTTTGTLVGDATDESNAPLAGVSISISGPDGIKIVITDASGKYIFPYLTPAHYNVRAELGGFTSVERNDVRIGLGQRLEISFKMTVSVHERITVSGESALVEVKSTTVSANISNQLTDRIPIGRSLGDIVYLAPGVVNGGIGGANLMISGGSGRDNSYVVDGAIVTNPGTGGVGTISHFHGFQGDNGLPLEAIKEVQVITGGFEPEYGEAQGGVINVITKSGSNNFHGQGYTYCSPPAAGDEFQREQYGADAGVNIGGPIIKNKLFFFGAYNVTSSKSRVFLQPEWPGYALLKEVTSSAVSHAYSLKVTANLTSSHSIEFSASGQPSYRPLSNQDGNQLNTSVNPLLAQTEWRFGSNSQVLRWNGTLSPNMFLEAQAARAHNEFHDIPGSLGKNLHRIIDYTSENGPLDIGGYGGGLSEDSNNLQYSVKLTNIWKNHQFRYGLQFEDISYSPLGARTGGAFLTSDGQLSNYRIDIKPGEDEGFESLPKVYVVNIWSQPKVAPTSSKYLDWFAQDSWNLTSALNVTLGVRWERQQLKEDLNGAGFTFSNNWAPRIGATYDYLRNGTSKLFFHHGRFFEKLPNYLAESLLSYYETDEIYSDPDLTDLLRVDKVGVRVGSSVEGHGNSNSRYRTSGQYSNEWIAGIEQEVKPGFSLGASLIVRNLRHAVEGILVNPTTYDPVTAEDLSANPSLVALRLVTNVDGHSPGVPALVRNYKAVEITAEKRLSNRWQLMASYRYAQLIGNYQGHDFDIFGTAGAVGLSPFTEFSWAKGPLPYDIRNMVKLFSSYQLRANLNTGIAFYFQTGRPITALKLGDFGLFQNSPRSAFGRTDSITSVDVNANYSVKVLKEQQITFGVDIFNLFNSQGVTAVDETEAYYNQDLQFTPWDYFLDPIENQSSRSFRLLLRYSF